MTRIRRPLFYGLRRRFYSDDRWERYIGELAEDCRFSEDDFTLRAIDALEREAVRADGSRYNVAGPPPAKSTAPGCYCTNADDVCPYRGASGRPWCEEAVEHRAARTWTSVYHRGTDVPVIEAEYPPAVRIGGRKPLGRPRVFASIRERRAARRLDRETWGREARAPVRRVDRETWTDVLTRKVYTDEHGALRRSVHRTEQP